jgi:two-component system response regulator GlrR
VVDDDPQLLRLLSMRLTANGYEVQTAQSGKEALGRMAGSRPHLLITDLRMEGMDGMALFEAVHRQHPTLPVVILTAHGTIPDAVEATQRGVAAYLTKPFDGAELLARVERLCPSGDGTGDPHGWHTGIVSRSRVMQELLEQAARVAASDVNVLIRGQSGTGKEVLARAVHTASARRARRFVPLNCAAIPESLLESELFGHSRGSFTGASQSHKGLFQQAHEGTLLLDEIGDMPLALQAKLLRALEDRQIRALGATQPVVVDVRIISATHRDLEQAIGAGEFREDLYYRLNVVTLEIPALRERREDIPVLANDFLSEIRARGPEQPTGFAPEAMALLVAAPWPGNVRQLRNVVEQCAVLSTTPLVAAGLVERALRHRPDELPPFAEARDRFELDYLVRLLEITQGNVTQAARLAGRNRSEFYKLLRRHHLEPEAFRA